jgi:hypothetical protein
MHQAETAESDSFLCAISIFTRRLECPSVRIPRLPGTAFSKVRVAELD